ncbi:MAG: hypothetical protein KA749_03235, partial [Acidovorax sp.]|nr:hypothetical protein [Acidovorax sp.]
DEAAKSRAFSRLGLTLGREFFSCYSAKRWAKVVKRATNARKSGAFKIRQAGVQGVSRGVIVAYRCEGKAFRARPAP